MSEPAWGLPAGPAYKLYFVVRSPRLNSSLWTPWWDGNCTGLPFRETCLGAARRKTSVPSSCHLSEANKTFKQRHLASTRPLSWSDQWEWAWMEGGNLLLGHGGDGYTEKCKNPLLNRWFSLSVRGGGGGLGPDPRCVSRPPPPFTQMTTSSALEAQVLSEVTLSWQTKQMRDRGT